MNIENKMQACNKVFLYFHAFVLIIATVSFISLSMIVLLNNIVGNYFLAAACILLFITLTYLIISGILKLESLRSCAATDYSKEPASWPKQSANLLLYISVGSIWLASLAVLYGDLAQLVDDANFWIWLGLLFSVGMIIKIVVLVLHMMKVKVLPDFIAKMTPRPIYSLIGLIFALIIVMYPLLLNNITVLCIALGLLPIVSLEITAANLYLAFKKERASLQTKD